MLASKHDKLPLIAPPLWREVGLTVVGCQVDTDALGTFAGEVPRTLSMGQAAIAKARLGMESQGCSIGLASEGTVAPDPVTGMLLCDIEMISMVDAELEIVVSEIVRDFSITAVSETVTDWQGVLPLLVRADFPAHLLIVRPEGLPIVDLPPDLLVKAIADEGSLRLAVERCISASPVGQARVESDLRAHCSPSRRRVINQAAEALARRLASQCPSCSVPGWGQVDLLRGLTCRACGMWLPRAQRGVILGCARCAERVEVPADRPFEDPSRCHACNP